MTPLTTSPCFTVPPAMAFFTEPTTTSPIDAYRRREPPSTLMHMTVFAPVLSATSSMVWAWIMGSRFLNEFRGRCGLGLLHDPHQAEMLRLRDGPAFDDLDAVALLRDALGGRAFRAGPPP